MASTVQPAPETPVTIKVNIDGTPRRFKLPLRDVGINVLESKLRTALSIPADAEALFERYSDSAASYVVLDQANTAVYKQLYRAAKAKHKLKLRVTVKKEEPEEKEGPKPASVVDEPEEESRTSVEPTDTEREPEQSTVSQSSHASLKEEATPEPAPKVEAPQAEKAQPPAEWKPYSQTSMPLPPAVPRMAPFIGANWPSMRANYAVCCNSCDRTIPDSHYHCSTCDDGDFDLCQDCVDRGVSCKGTNHWLIKRFLKNGIIINSTTERLAPKPRPKAQSPQVPGPAPTAQERIIPLFNDATQFFSIRTCNCCVSELPEAEFLHCTTCDDYDLCKGCFAKNRHGHHPGHAFTAAVQGTRLAPDVARRLSPGRGQPHHAICDGCDKGIKGVRHKCLDCPDWDYCSSCVLNASFIHAGHRFVPIYEPLVYDMGARFRSQNRSVHVGIRCDGPLCSGPHANSTYIVGDRYKCAVCHDTDFCAACEASPANSHNRTHPFIKFKTPVRRVSVTTTGENEDGRPIPTMGDRFRSRPGAASNQSTETDAPPSLFSGIRTVVDVQPVEPAKSQEVQVEEKLAQLKLDDEKMPELVRLAEKKPPVAPKKPASVADLVATYVRDTVQDGTVLGPDHVFEQTWVLRNDGDVDWPAGCSVKFVGGDYMGHLDQNHPAATKDVEFSCESTVCYAAIQPGEEFPFTVLLRTPHRPGRVVSNWRLMTKEGMRFGHRLWCDIEVKPKPASPPPAAAEPAVPVVVVKQEEVEEKAEKAVETEPEPEHSQMIFPKLEKESPVASVHEEEAAAPKAESSAVIEDEYEVCSWNEDDDDEEAFLTDEEYDVLDASDEESLGGGHALKK